MGERNLKFGQMHAIIEIIALITAIEYFVRDGGASVLFGMIVFASCAIVDIILARVLGKDQTVKNRILIGIRIAEFLLLSAFIVYNDSGIRETEVISFILLFVRMIEMIFLFDYSDKYTRVIVIGTMIFPITAFVLVKLLLISSSADYGNNAILALGSIAEIAAVVAAVFLLCNIFVSWLLASEHKIFEQRRMTEKTEEMNETLKLHQEKIKKANEELGIQRIKMETANRQIQHVNAEINTQNELLKNVAACLDIQSLSDKIPEAMCESMDNLLFCCVLLAPVTKKGSVVFNARAKNISEGFLQAYSAEIISKGLNNKDSRTPSVDKELNIDSMRFCTESDMLCSIAKIPLFKDDKEEGIIYLGSNIRDNFDDSENLFSNIAAQILLGINNITLYTAVEQMAINDGLTGIFNRRTLNEKMSQMGHDAENNHTPLSAALFDIDHFKGFNDTYGHACGDVVLQKLASLLDEAADKYGGIAARYGGEEFVLVFPECNREKCQNILEETKGNIDRATVEYDGKTLSVSVSIGFSTYPEIRKSSNELLGCADSAMYYAKEHGRNQIKCDGPDVDEFEAGRKRQHK